jgi:hypothetical protein
MWHMHPTANRKNKVRFFDVPQHGRIAPMAEQRFEAPWLQVRILFRPQEALQVSKIGKR